MTDPERNPYGAGGFRFHRVTWRSWVLSTEWTVGWRANCLLRVGESSAQRRADVDVDTHFGYGYHWFTVTSMEGFPAVGNGGQIILVIPESDLVIVTTAATQESIFG